MKHYFFFIVVLLSYLFPLYITILYLEEIAILPKTISYNYEIVSTLLNIGLLTFLIQVICIVGYLSKKIELNKMLFFWSIVNLFYWVYIWFIDPLKILQFVLD